MWPLHPGFGNQYTSISTLFKIGCLDVGDTQLLILLVKGSIVVFIFVKNIWIFTSFTSNGLSSL